MEALKEIQLRFYKDFPPHPKEQIYGFATPSTMKPTQWSCKFRSVVKRISENYLPMQVAFLILNYSVFVSQIPGVVSIKYQLSAPFQEMLG